MRAMDRNKAPERVHPGGSVVDITKYLRDCRNCIYGNDGNCLAPGGYEYDWRKGVCRTFRRKPKGGGE